MTSILAVPAISSGAQRQRDYQNLKARVHQELLKRLNLERLTRVSREDAEPEVRALIQELIDNETKTVPLSLGERDTLVVDVLNELFGLGPLEVLLRDPDISDILVNRFDRVYIERNGKLEETEIVFKDDQHLLLIIERIVSSVGRRIDESSPMVDARLRDGSRVNAIIPPLALDGPALSIRRFRTTRLGAPDLVERETLTQPMLDFLEAAVMQRRIGFVRDGVKRLIDFLRPDDRVIVAPFSRHLTAVTGPTTDHRTVADAIQNIRATGGTAILDSLVEVVKQIPTGLTRRAVVLITDGYDEDSSTPIGEVIAAVKAAQVTVYVIGIGGVAGVSRIGERALRRLASETGGQTFLPRDDAVATVQARLAADVQNRYLVSYTPTNQERDGTWRNVTLRTTPGYIVRTRDGYNAPTPPPVRPELEFTITDKSRRYLDLGPDDLTVFEDGIEQKVDAFHEVVAPVSIVLALDSSGSMKKSATEAMAAAREFVEVLRPEDSLGLLEFADRADLVHDLTTVRDGILKTIGQYTAGGGTALYDALCDALARLDHVDGRRAIVLVTDGRDENNPGTAPGSVRTAQDVLDLLAQANTTIYTIGLGPKVDHDFLQNIANLSSGESYFPDDVEGLRADYRRVVENLRRRYVVSYTSTNGARDGSWRRVEIRPRPADVVVRSRGGYFAPER